MRLMVLVVVVVWSLSGQEQGRLFNLKINKRACSTLYSNLNQQSQRNKVCNWTTFNGHNCFVSQFEVCWSVSKPFALGQNLTCTFPKEGALTRGFIRMCNSSHLKVLEIKSFVSIYSLEQISNRNLGTACVSNRLRVRSRAELDGPAVSKWQLKCWSWTHFDWIWSTTPWQQHYHRTNH